jgi:PAS domain-containing protein
VTFGHQILFWNQAVETVFGLSRKAAVGRSLIESMTR